LSASVELLVYYSDETFFDPVIIVYSKGNLKIHTGSPPLPYSPLPFFASPAISLFPSLPISPFP